MIVFPSYGLHAPLILLRLGTGFIVCSDVSKEAAVPLRFPSFPFEFFFRPGRESPKKYFPWSALSCSSLQRDIRFLLNMVIISFICEMFLSSLVEIGSVPSEVVYFSSADVYYFAVKGRRTSPRDGLKHSYANSIRSS
jgi:hypothetical protein